MLDAGRHDLSVERAGGGADRGEPPVLLLGLYPHLDVRRDVHRSDP